MVGFLIGFWGEVDGDGYDEGFDSVTLWRSRVNVMGSLRKV